MLKTKINRRYLWAFDASKNWLLLPSKQTSTDQMFLSTISTYCTSQLQFHFIKHYFHGLEGKHTVDFRFTSDLQRPHTKFSAMTSRARAERSGADPEQLGSLLVPLISQPSPSDKLSSHGMILREEVMICLDLNCCHRPTAVEGMKNESACSLVWLTSKLEILTYLYSESVSSAGPRLRQRSKRQENKYHSGRPNIWD